MTDMGDRAPFVPAGCIPPDDASEADLSPET